LASFGGQEVNPVLRKHQDPIVLATAHGDIDKLEVLLGKADTWPKIWSYTIAWPVVLVMGLSEREFHQFHSLSREKRRKIWKLLADALLDMSVPEERRMEWWLGLKNLLATGWANGFVSATEPFLNRLLNWPGTEGEAERVRKAIISATEALNKEPHSAILRRQPANAFLSIAQILMIVAPVADSVRTSGAVDVREAMKEVVMSLGWDAEQFEILRKICDNIARKLPYLNTEGIYHVPYFLIQAVTGGTQETLEEMAEHVPARTWGLATLVAHELELSSPSGQKVWELFYRVGAEVFGENHMLQAIRDIVDIYPDALRLLNALIPTDGACL